VFNELVSLWYFIELIMSIGIFSDFIFFSFLSSVLSLLTRSGFSEIVQVNLRANTHKDSFFFLFNAD
jgi:hypothetical protein